MPCYGHKKRVRVHQPGPARKGRHEFSLRIGVFLGELMILVQGFAGCEVWRRPVPPKIAVLIFTPSMPKAVVSLPAAPVAASFEVAQQELERLVAQLESGDMPLEQLLTGYQRGAELLNFCRDRLEAVESQIKVLDAQGLKAWTPD